MSRLTDAIQELVASVGLRRSVQLPQEGGEHRYEEEDEVGKEV